MYQNHQLTRHLLACGLLISLLSCANSLETNTPIQEGEKAIPFNQIRIEPLYSEGQLSLQLRLIEFFCITPQEAYGMGEAYQQQVHLENVSAERNQQAINLLQKRYSLSRLQEKDDEKSPQKLKRQREELDKEKQEHKKVSQAKKRKEERQNK